MKISLNIKEKLILLDFGKKAYSIQRHGYPNEKLWNSGFSCYLYKSFKPFFLIIAYEKF